MILCSFSQINTLKKSAGAYTAKFHSRRRMAYKMTVYWINHESLSSRATSRLNCQHKQSDSKNIRRRGLNRIVWRMTAEFALERMLTTFAVNYMDPLAVDALLKLGMWQRKTGYTRITGVYPADFWWARWVYAGKNNGRLVYGVYPRIPPNTPLVTHTLQNTLLMYLGLYTP